MCVRACVCERVCVHVHMCVCALTVVYWCVRACERVCVCMYTCVYVPLLLCTENFTLTKVYVSCSIQYLNSSC